MRHPARGPACGDRRQVDCGQTPTAARRSRPIRAGLSLTAFALLSACASAPDRPGSSVGTPQFAAPQSAPNADARARAHTDLGAAYYELGNMAVALEELQIALEARADFAPAHNMLGLVYMELRDPPRAQASFERALRLAPDDPDTNHNYGWFLCQSGREQQSLKFFMDAVRNPLYRTPAKTYTTAGICMNQLKRSDDAMQLLDRALSLDPAYAPAMLPLARLRMQRGEIEEARTLVRRFNARGTPTAASLWLALLIERRRGNTQAEESLATQLRRRFPDSKEVQALQRGQFE